jgi:hypothetical protein
MPAGRPSEYDPAYCEQAKKLCRLGATDVEISDFFGVSPSTFYRWSAEHEEFRESIKTGKDFADERVERSLYAKAVGYEHDDTDVRVADGVIVQTPVRKIYPPDSTAAIFWLKNRRRSEWPDKQNVVPQNPDGTALGIMSQIAGAAIVPKPSKE